MKQIHTVAIIGAGALGVMYGQRLTQRLGAENVAFIADEQRIRRYREEGIYCNGERCEFRYLPIGSPSPKVDLILFAVKFSAIEQAVCAAGEFAHENTIFLSVLNGIQSEAVIGGALGEKHLLYCVAQGMDAAKRGNQAHYQNMGTVVFGDRENRETGDVTALRDLLERAGIDYRVPEDIFHAMWSKLMVNAGANQVTAVLDVNYDGIQKPGDARQMVIDTMREVQRVAALEGVRLTDAEVDRWMAVLDSLNPNGMPSLRQDILAHRPTEVELFAGAICALGEKHGVKTPMSDYLYREIKRLEQVYSRG